MVGGRWCLVISPNLEWGELVTMVVGEPMEAASEPGQGTLVRVLLGCVGDLVPDTGSIIRLAAEVAADMVRCGRGGPGAWPRRRAVNVATRS